METPMNRITGRIIKGIGGFYYVHDEKKKIFECRARGIFRNKKLKPLVGDQVVIEVIDPENKTGNLVEILPRSSELIRPASANVDQALVLFAAKDPDPNYILLDKFLITVNLLSLPTILCFNKIDRISYEEQEKLYRIYRGACRLHFISVKEKSGLEELKSCLQGKTTVLAGPSGAGKSSFLNYFCPESQAQTGAVSEKIGRGRHTTRHSELFYVAEDTYLMDTPGFSSLYINAFEKEEFKYYFREFAPYEGQCKFIGCDHIHEPGCAVKQALEEGKIHPSRYQNYLEMYEEQKEKRRY